MGRKICVKCNIFGFRDQSISFLKNVMRQRSLTFQMSMVERLKAKQEAWSALMKEKKEYKYTRYLFYQLGQKNHFLFKLTFFRPFLQAHLKCLTSLERGISKYDIETSRKPKTKSSLSQSVTNCFTKSFALFRP